MKVWRPPERKREGEEGERESPLSYSVVGYVSELRSRGEHIYVKVHHQAVSDSVTGKMTDTERARVRLMSHRCAPPPDISHDDNRHKHRSISTCQPSGVRVADLQSSQYRLGGRPVWCHSQEFANAPWGTARDSDSREEEERQKSVCQLCFLATTMLC